MCNDVEKKTFLSELKRFAGTLGSLISQDGEWTVRGFIDIFKTIHTISPDTKVVSKILELHLFPHFLSFAESIGYEIELASCQNWYPDLTFIKKGDASVKFAVDLKTTIRDEECPEFCHGFTLGSHGAYFSDRASTKNIQYPYGEYSGHFCLGIIYSRVSLRWDEELRTYSVDEVNNIPSVIRDFVFFAEEKWRIASDKSGSGNTANIGSINKIEDILSGNGVFSKAGEKLFDDYWVNYGKLEIAKPDGTYKKLSTFEELLEYRGLCKGLNTPRASKRKGKK